jgi:hypothetical protein
MDMTELKADELRDCVEDAVRVWFRERATEGDTLTRIRYQLDISYSAVGDYRDRGVEAVGAFEF